MTSLLLMLAMGQKTKVWRFESPADAITVSAFSPESSVEYDFESNGLGFNCFGDPASVDVASRGMVLKADQLSGQTASASDGKYVIKEAHALGHGFLSFDSDDEETGRRNRAAKTGSNFVPNFESSRTLLRTDRLDYAGTETEAKLKLPAKFTIDSAGKGTAPFKRKNTITTLAYDQSGSIEGQSADITIEPQSKSAGSIVKDGVFHGPVHFKFTRNETTSDDRKLSTYVVSGVCDEMRLSTKEGSTMLEASGHIVIDSSAPQGTGHVEGDKGSVTLNESLKPVRIVVGDGSKPTVTTIHLKGNTS